jgi:DNA adenine methylase
MILRRLGNKSRIANEIQKYFPEHTMYIEPFFGAGGMFFNKPKAKYNILNDNDSEVFNLFNVVMHSEKELEDTFLKMPISEDLWNYWKKTQETDPILKALRFLFLSNYGFMGQTGALRLEADNTSTILLENLGKTHKFMFDVRFMNVDFREVIKKIAFKDKNNTFIYADPPYLDTRNNYQTGFTPKDSEDLLQMLIGSGCKFAISEFDHPKIMELAELHKLNIEIIGERENLKNRRVEILVTNYKIQGKLFY